MRNPAFERALWAMIHPVTVVAILLLLINDHLLRWRWPSWWTGKIGDVAWLIFAPPLLAALLAWLMPRRLRRRPLRLGYFALTLVGAVFALVKTVPIAHAAFQTVYNATFPWDSMLYHDPTDILALPALLIAAWVWTRPYLCVPERRPPRYAWIAISLAALTTIANSAAPDLGITCLAVEEDRVVAHGLYTYSHVCTSQDGGLTWESLQVENLPVDISAHCEERPDVWVLETPDAHYRFRRGESIARSTDGGQTWEIEIELDSSEARMAYYRKTRAQGPLEIAHPEDAVWDPTSGHVIAAMGRDGVLVHTPEDGWQRVDACGYRFESPTAVQQIATILQHEFWLALLLIALLFNVRGAPDTSRWLLPVLILGWLLWGLAVLLKPALQAGYDLFFILFLDVGAGLFTLPLCIYHVIRLIRRELDVRWQFALLASGGGLLFFLPYVVWALGLLPRYNVALIGALFVSQAFHLLVWYVGIRAARHVTPVVHEISSR